MKTRFFMHGLKMNADGGSGSPAPQPTPQPTPETPPKQEDPKTKVGNDQESLYLKELEKLKKENSKLIQSQREKEQKEAEKNGEFEKLYLEMKKQNENLTSQYKKDKIKNAVTLKAKDMGLSKTDFIKLMDLSELDMDDEGSVIGMSEALESFKSNFPELFTVDGSNTKDETDPKPVPPTDQARKPFARGIQVDTIDELNKIIKDPNTSRRMKEQAIAKRLSLQFKKK